MLKKKIIIHCGVPKTGSSALQVQLAQSKEMFLKYSYDYPAFGATQVAKAGGITSGNGIVLASTYFPDGHPARSAHSREKETAKMRRTIAQSDNHVILSSEFFTRMPCQNLGALAASLADLGEVQLVFFVREQVNLLAAAYIQRVKRAMCTQFPDAYFDDLNFSDRPHLAYNTYFTALKKAAPDATILVKPYELSQDHSAGLMGLFLEMIDAQIPVEDLPVNRFINLSPSPKEVRLMIELNKHGPRRHFSDMLVEASHQAGRSKAYAIHGIVPPKAVTQIREFYAAENEAFFANFTDSENIYHDHAREFIDLREIAFDAQDVMDILLGLLVKMDHRLTTLETQRG